MIPIRSNLIRYSTGLKHWLNRYSMQRLPNQYLLTPQRDRFQSLDIRDAVDRLQRQLSELVPSTTSSSDVFRKNLLLRLNHINGNIQDMLQGKLIFESTETWRSVYEEVLDSVKAKSYFSVALIRSEDYWQDQPGNASLEFNYRLIEHGFFIHRLFIIDDFFWAPSVQTPAKSLHNWITAQKHRGIEVTLVRLSALDDDPHLVCDFGIYGNDAVGYQETDFQGRTTRFELHFDAKQIEKAKAHWNQLKLYSQPYVDIVTVP